MVSIVIVGFGGMGGWHYRNIKKNKLLNLVGVFDIDEKANEKARALGLKVYGSFDEVIGDTGVKAVLISAPNETHCDYVERAAGAGKHILCEKPVTMSSELLDRMIGAAERNRVVFIVNQNRRQDMDYLTVCKAIESGEMGRVYKIESNVMSSHGVPGDWRKDKERGGGMILDWGVHLIDQLLYFFEAKVVSVYCKNSYVFGLDVDDGCDIRLSFDDGTEAKLYIDTNALCPLPRWTVYGENGSAVLRGWRRRGKMVLVRERLDKKNRGIQAGNGFTKTMADRSKSSTFRKRLPKVVPDADSIYRNFADAVMNGTEIIIKHEELRRVMKVMEACFLSDEKKQVVEVNI
jgi:predicted dehydrogenase